MFARNLSFRHLHAFVYVAQMGSFTKAADKLAMAQPTLTLNIQQFEEIVGASLFTRTTRTVALTPAGKLLLGRIESLLCDFDNALMQTRTLAAEQENCVRVIALPSVVVRLLPSVISAMSTMYPESVIQLHDNNGSGVQTAVLARKVDFGISSIWEPHPDLEYTPFVKDRIGIVCHANHPLAKVNGLITWDQMQQYPFVGMADNTSICRMIQRFDTVPEAIRFPAYQVLTLMTLVGVLDDAQHISMLPALASPDYLSPSLVIRDIEGDSLYRELCLVQHRKVQLSHTASAFYQLINVHKQAMCSRFPNGVVQPY